MEKKISDGTGEPLELCVQAKQLLNAGHYEACLTLAAQEMEKHPSSAIPHNIYGVAKGAQGDTAEALRHFRAAWALDPTYLPARCNLDYCGSLFFGQHYVLEEAECHICLKSGATITHDSYGIQHVEGE
ncbi:MAG: hypothetical protein LKJ90_08340 [Faecalibacterium sp.]|jgi:tetratricopeptide (TPR) repeat protein|nr:hypothetical protein [Faecalibacterium sp.]